MNQTVELVNLWGAYEAQHPSGTIEDFCRHHLIHQRESENIRPTVGGVIPKLADGLLLKMIGRITKLHALYAAIALEGTGINRIEEFGILVTIQQAGHPRKTEVVYANIQEPSSGSDMMTRLKKRGFITEYADQEDKRSKRVRLTAEGEKIIAICKERVGKLARMMLHDMSTDDKQLCIQLLKQVESKFSLLWQGHKGKNFDDIYAELVPPDGHPTL